MTTGDGRLGDAVALERLRAGDEALLRQVVEELTPVLTRLAREYTSSAWTAQDAVQDTWVTVLDKLSSTASRAVVPEDLGLRDPGAHGTAARDVLGMDAAEAAVVLRLTAGNERVLLHRARSKVRAAVEQYTTEALTRRPGPVTGRERPRRPAQDRRTS